MFVAYHKALAGQFPTASGSLLGARISKSLAIVQTSREDDPLKTYERLLEALTTNLLHFRLDGQDRWELMPLKSADILDVSHGITLANAVRKLASKYPQLC